MGLLLLQGASDLNPRELFANGEQGLWLDPSQMSTLYQDSNGVTPCTAAGDPVGLILDQSRGGLGAVGAELVTNGDFSNGTTGWSESFPSVVRLNGVVSGMAELEVINTSSGTGGIDQAISTVSGKWYIAKCYIQGQSGNSAFIRESTNAINGSPIFGSGVSTLIFRATGSSTTIRAAVSLTNEVIGEKYYFDNISVREVPGNHAYQTTSASRPTLARIPSSGRRNLLLNTEPADSTGYAFATNVSFVTESAFSFLPSGGRAASYGDASVNRRLQFNFTSFVIGQTYTLSFYIYLDGGVEPNQGAGLYRDFTLTRDGADVTNYANITYDNIGGGVYRVKHTWTHTGAGTSLTIWKYSGLSTNTNFRASGFQLETGSTATNLQRVGSTHDVTESGVSDLWHLVFDGSDDSLVTNSVDFTGTDEMTVIAGVRKLSDAVRGTVVELSASWQTNNGTFGIEAPEGTPGTGYRFASKGTSSDSQTPTPFTAPLTRVLTLSADISSPSLIARVNSSVVATSTASQGTGNFGNHVVWIGRRGGADLPYNGHLFQLIIRGKTTPTGKLLEAERFVARKTGVTGI